MQIDRLALTRDQRDDAAGFLAIDEALHALMQALEAIGSDANTCRSN